MEKEVICGNGQLAFGEGVKVATKNMTSGNNVLKSVYSPLRMCCCNAAGNGGRDCDNIGSRESTCGVTAVLGGMDEAVDIASSLDA